MSEQTPITTLPEFEPTLHGFRAEEFLALTEDLLTFPIEQDQAALDAAPFHLSRPEPRPEPPFAPLPPRWYPRPAEAIVEAARASLMPPPRPTVLEGRSNDLTRILRPLLAGHPVTVCGEPGVGKTTLLAHIAHHERTRQRFRRIWWFDQPARIDQTLALALNLPHILAEPDPVARRNRLIDHIAEHGSTPALDDNTLLIIDNAQPDDPALARLHDLTSHILLSVETTPVIPDPDEPVPADPEGTTTLRALDDAAAIDTLAYFAGIEDTRRLRAHLLRIATALGHHPYALKLAGILVARDGLSLDELEELLALDQLLAALQAEALRGGGSETRNAEGSPENDQPVYIASLNRALDVSVEALPRDYRRLFDAFGSFPPGGAPLDGLASLARLDSPLAARRGLLMLEQYGFIRRDHRSADRYIMHPVAFARALQADDEHPAQSKAAKQMRQWAVHFVREHADDHLALYHAEPSLLAAYQSAQEHGPIQVAEPLAELFRPYLLEYAPGLLSTPPDVGDLDGPRAEAAQLTQNGIELTDQGAVYAAEEVLQRALELREAHASQHAIAETLVALARLHEVQGRYDSCTDYLIRAAEIVYHLDAEDSLSVIRRGLARAYRRLGRFAEALEVLDDAPEARLERAAVLRAQGNYAAAVQEMGAAENARPFQRAEIALLAGQYEDALAAIEDEEDAESALLRAQVYHLQGDIEQAVASYRTSLEQDAEPDTDEDTADSEQDTPALRAKAYRGLGAALASGADFDGAHAAFEEALALQQEQDPPDSLLLGRTLRLLAAVHLATGRIDEASANARAALVHLKKTNAHTDTADAFQTLGRALWRAGEHMAALEAFEGEVERAQSAPERNEPRVGIALHHLADAHRATGSLDRAIANYRRALTHKNAFKDPSGYQITQLALHRALMEEDRIPTALEVAQEIIDHLNAKPDRDLQHIGVGQVVRARTQQVAQRPIRALQSLHEWTAALVARAESALADERPALGVLVLGLAVRSLLAEGRPALALSLAERACALTAAHFANTPADWAAIRDLAEVHMALDRLHDAINTLSALHLEPVQAEPATFALAHALAGKAHHKLDDPEAALVHLENAAEFEPVEHHRGLLQEQIAAIYLGTNEPVAAIDHLHAALPLLDREENPDDAARALTTLAHTLGGVNRYAEAIGVYEDALIVLRDVEGVDPTHTADVLRSLGQTHEAQGQRDEAARAYRRALNLLERIDAPRQKRDLLHQLARVTAAMGDQSAVALYEQTRDATEKWGDTLELGSVFCELADVHRDAGRFAVAVQNYQAALNCQPAPPFLRERINSLRNLGRAYSSMERYDDARRVWEEALTLSTELPDQSPLETALTHHAIGEAHRSQGNTEEAVISFREALRHHTANTVEAAVTWRAVGHTLFEGEHYTNSIQALRYALDAEKAQPQQSNARLVETLQLLAGAHEASGENAQAIARHHEVLVYLDRDLQPVAYASTLRTLGGLYLKTGQFPRALKAFEDALAIENEIAPRSDERIADTLQAIADTYRAQNDLQHAAEYYQRVTVYANIARRASQDLRETLDELERRRATLQTAQQSLALLDRSDNTDFKDVIFITALIARSHEDLHDFAARDEAIESLVGVLAQHRDKLDTNASETDSRALAFLFIGLRAIENNEHDAAKQAFGIAHEAVRNANLRWLIERVMLGE